MSAAYIEMGASNCTATRRSHGPASPGASSSTRTTLACATRNVVASSVM